MKPKTMVIVFDDIFIGGALTLCESLFNDLLKIQKNRLLVITGVSGDQSNKLKYFPYADKIYSYSMPPLIQPLRFLYISIFTLQYLFRLMKLEKIDIIISNYTFSAVATSLFCFIYKIQHVYFFHGALYQEKASLISDTEINMSSIRIRFILWCYRIAQKIVLFSSQVICFSNYSKKLLAYSFNKNDVSILPVSIKYHEVNSITKRAVKKKLGFNEHTLLCLIPSRFEPRKGQHLLMDAIRLLKTRKFITFLFLGPIHPQAVYYLYNIIRNSESNFVLTHVYFSGEKNNNRLKLYYQAADVTIIPSISCETFGMVMLESLSFGTPVIGYSTGAIPEILNHIDKQLIAKDTSPQSLAERIDWYSTLSITEKRRLVNSIRDYIHLYHHHKVTTAKLRHILCYE